MTEPLPAGSHRIRVELANVDPDSDCSRETVCFGDVTDPAYQTYLAVIELRS